MFDGCGTTSPPRGTTRNRADASLDTFGTRSCGQGVAFTRGGCTSSYSLDQTSAPSPTLHACPSMDWSAHLRPG